MVDSDVYDERYYRGNGAISSYQDYLVDAKGPCRILAETLVRIFRPRSTLDVGCAVGYTVKSLRELGVEAYGCDVSSWAVEIAASPSITKCDVSRNPLERTVELVYAYDVVEHIPELRLDYALENMWSHCTKHLLIVPDLFPEGTKTDPRDVTHVTLHDRDWWIQKISDVTATNIDDNLYRILNEDQHTTIFNYTGRPIIFSKA